MITRLKPGTRLRSAVSTTEVIVLRAPEATVQLCCGERPMIDLADGERFVDPAIGGETLLGKRYAHPGSGLEVLCTSEGKGSLSVDGQSLEVMTTKKLPASD